MADELREIENVETIQTTTVETRETVTAAAGPATTYVATAPASRGAWDFTNAQRVILAILIWLNILMFAVGYLAVTGRLAV